VSVWCVFVCYLACIQTGRISKIAFA